jgi:two-component system NtrC family sensor kinase
VSVRVARRISGPIHGMALAAQRIAQGDYSRAVDGGGDDELGYLARSFNTMTAEVQLAHQALRESADVLERKVEERTADLRRMQAQMIQSEKMVAIGKLAAGVAHEINNPLTGILTNSSLMLEDLGDDHPWQEDIQVIVNETLRCRKIVKGLLDFSRQTRPQRTLLDLNHVVEDTIALVRNQTAFRNVQITLDLDRHLPTVLADADQMRQIVLNLVLNAAEAMPQGGELRVASSADATRNAVELRVADTGPGIPDEVKARIFEPFFTTKKTGTGLGLAVVYGIIERHHGQIRVDTARGYGTTFTISVPIGEADDDD